MSYFLTFVWLGPWLLVWLWLAKLDIKAESGLQDKLEKSLAGFGIGQLLWTFSGKKNPTPSSTRFTATLQSGVVVLGVIVMVNFFPEEVILIDVILAVPLYVSSFS